MKHTLYQSLINRLKNKHSKLATRFHKSIQEGEFQKQRYRKRKESIERLKSLEKRISGLGKESGLKIALNYKHWAVALALGVVVSASGQETKKKFNERYHEQVATQLAGDLPLAQTVFFDPAVSLGIPYISRAFTGDIDGDGDIDAIILSYVDNPLILFNDGGFSFSQGEIPINTNGIIERPQLADFDGDGDLDLFVRSGPYGSATHSIWLNDGAANFTEQPVTFPTFDLDFDQFKTADIDGDGDLDMIGNTFQTVSPYNRFVTLFRNTAFDFTDTTALKNPYSALPDSYFANVMDYDNDGDFDILFTGYYLSVGNSLQVFANDGLGNFSAPGFYSSLVNGLYEASDTLDIDNDGDTDFVTGINIYPDASFIPYLNNGVGNFTSASQTILSNNQGIDEINGFDIDNDGFPDLVLNTNVDSTFVFVNNGDGTVSQQIAFLGQSIPADVDGDLDGDLFFFDGDLLIQENQGGATWFQRPDIVNVSSSYDSDLVDIDGDGDLDIVTGSQVQSRIWSNDGLGNFTIAQEIGRQGFSQEFGDLDGDGDPDMIRAIEQGYYPGLDIWLNTAGNLAFNSNIGTGTAQFRRIKMDTLDADADLDILALVRIPGTLGDTLYLRNYSNNGGVTFGVANNTTIPYRAQDMDIGDIDGDNDIDVVIGYENPGFGFRSFINDGTGVFTAGSFSPTPLGSGVVSDIDLADLDGDGDLDVFATNPNPGDSSYVFLNDGLGTFTHSASRNIPTTTFSYKSYLGDVDSDGDIDIVFGGYISFPRLWVNDGAANFVFDSDIPSIADEYAKVLIGDLDGDSDQDIVVGGYYTGTKVFFNQAAALPVNATDSLALVALYNATSGPLWTNNTNWLTGTVDTWFGVTVVGDRVTEIVLDDDGTTSFTGNNLNGAIPPSIGDLDALTTLNLASNQLTGSIPVEIGNLISLNYLYLSQNQLTGDIPVEIGSLSGLIELDLYKNFLTGSIPTELNNISSLTTILLDNNLLTGIVPELTGSSSTLAALNVRLNELDSLPDFSAFLSLIDFQVDSNRFTFEDLEPNAGVITSIIDQKTFGLPQSLLINPGDNQLLNSNIPGVGVNDAYQWFLNGTDIAGAVDTTYNILSADLPDAGIYEMAVTNSLFPNDTIWSSQITVAVSSAIDQTDSLALVALYNATDGANWTNNSNWLTGTVDTWFGINVIGNKVTEINLDDDGTSSFAGNNLIGTIPPEIGNLNALLKLNLAGNQLTGSIPTEIGNLFALNALYLSQNQLSGTIPDLSLISGLAELTLFENQLTGTIPTTLGNLVNLQILFLGDNQLTGTIPTLLENLLLMQRFDVRNNLLTGTIPVNFGLWSDLIEFGVSGNQLTGALPAGFSTITGITFLDLSNNQFSDLPDLSAWTSTTFVGLNDNAFEFDDLEPNAALNGVNYTNQAPVPLSLPPVTEIPVGTAQDVSVTIGGTTNTYTWSLNGTAIPASDAATYTIAAIDRSNMGSYDVSVTNATVPGLTINSTGAVDILATAIISVDVQDKDDLTSIAENVNGYVFEIVNGVSTGDTLRQVNNSTSTFDFAPVVLGDFIVVAESVVPLTTDAQGTVNPDAVYIPTYFGDVFESEFAEILQLQGNTPLTILMQEVPPVLTEVDGQGVVSGTIEDDFGDAARIDARRRAAKRKCGLKKRRTGGRIGQDQDVYDLIAYGETNANGEFEYGFLPVGTYRFFVEYPGIPLDESAFVQFDVGEAGVSDDSFVLAVFVSPEGGIQIELILGITSKVFTDFNIYPNPTSNMLTVEYSKISNDRMSMEVLDLNGKTIMKQALISTQNKLELDTSELPAGQYLIRFIDSKDESNNSVFRLIKK